jgi:signal transduction histidine kinase
MALGASGTAGDLTERTRVRTALEKRVGELESVARLSTVIAGITDRAALLQAVVDLAREAFAARHAHVFLLDGSEGPADRPSLDLAASAGPMAAQLLAEQRALWLDQPRSLIARAARTGEAALENDVDQAPDYFAHPLLPDVRSELASPMLVGGHLIGVLDVQSDELQGFNPDDLYVLRILAAQVAVSLENARHFEETRQTLERRSHQVQLATDVAQRIAGAPALDELFLRVVTLVQERFGYYHAHIYMLDAGSSPTGAGAGDGRDLVMKAGSGEVGRAMKAAGHRISLAAERSLVARAARGGEPVLAPDVRQEPSWLPNALLPETRSEVAVPITLRGEVLGVLDVQNRTVGSLGSEDELLLLGLCGQVAVAIDYRRAETRREQVEAERERLILELERKNAELERFTYTVSHDLRSPLVTIMGFLGVLRRDLAKGDAELVERDSQHIHRAADQMQQLLNDLLELSRIGRLVNPPQEVPLAALVQEAVARVAGRIAERGVDVDVAPALPVAYGDRVRLTEVLQNLIENAVKFMGEQPRPRIEIGGRQDGKDVVCQVRDNGIGIEACYHSRIFGLFERLDSGTEGTGIGLSLVKRIVEVHGGRVWVESKGAGQGSTFFFMLPGPPERTPA